MFGLFTLAFGALSSVDLDSSTGTIGIPVVRSLADDDPNDYYDLNQRTTESGMAASGTGTGQCAGIIIDCGAADTRELHNYAHSIYCKCADTLQLANN